MSVSMDDSLTEPTESEQAIYKSILGAVNGVIWQDVESKAAAADLTEAEKANLKSAKMKFVGEDLGDGNGFRLCQSST